MLVTCAPIGTVCGFEQRHSKVALHIKVIQSDASILAETSQLHFRESSRSNEIAVSGIRSFFGGVA